MFFLWIGDEIDPVRNRAVLASAIRETLSFDLLAFPDDGAVVEHIVLPLVEGPFGTLDDLLRLDLQILGDVVDRDLAG